MQGTKGKKKKMVDVTVAGVASDSLWTRAHSCSGDVRTLGVVLTRIDSTSDRR